MRLETQKYAFGRDPRESNSVGGEKSAFSVYLFGLTRMPKIRNTYVYTQVRIRGLPDTPVASLASVLFGWPKRGEAIDTPNHHATHATHATHAIPCNRAPMARRVPEASIFCVK